MRLGSIRKRQHAIILMIVLLLSILALNIYFYLIVGSSEKKLVTIMSLKKAFSDILLDESASIRDPLEYETLVNQYAGLRRRFSDNLSHDEDSLLAERLTVSDRFFLDHRETVLLRYQVHRSFYELINSIRYIHEHHLVYLKNLMRHGVREQTYYGDEAFHRGDDRSASEVDIIKIASAMQTGLFDIVEIFDEAEKKRNLARVKEKFTRQMDVLNTMINRFESYSLDAQDGILVEELLMTSRQMVAAFSRLLTMEQNKIRLLEQMHALRVKILEQFDHKHDAVRQADTMLKKLIRVLQIISLVFVLVMASTIIISGRKTIEEAAKTIEETRRIQDDISYKIEMDADTSEEFRIIFNALNSMTRQINDYVGQMQESEKKYRLLVENQTDMIVKFDAGGKLLFVSPSLCRIFGMTSEALMETRFTALFHEGSRQNVTAALEKVVAEPPHHNYVEGLALTVKGTKWHAWLNTAVFDEDGRLDSVIGVGRDIHERKIAEEEIRKLFRAVDASPASVVITDEQGCIEYVNPKFCQVTGYTPEEAIGENPRILNSGEQPAEVFRDMWETISTGKEWHGIFCNRKKNGEIYWESAALAPVCDEQDRITHYVAVKEDITQRRHYEDDLKAARRLAEAADRAKSLFLANMSHEIRTPLNAVIGFLDLAMDEASLAPRPREFLETARKAAKSLLGVINDILDISKLESGKLVIENRPFNLSHLIREIWETMDGITRERDLDMRLDLDTDAAGWVMGDALRLRQVIMNLLNNAVKFTEKGHVLMQVRPAEEAGRFHFMIEDTGIGIPAHRKAQIFDPFIQAEESMTRRFGGTGLGTAICRELVNLMGGEIWVESEAGRGSCFHFIIPLPETDRVPAPSPLCAGADRPVGRGARQGFDILVAEDIIVNVNLVKIRLGKQHHRVRVAWNGKEAVAAFERHRPDIILMDIHMPEMDGIEATRRIREMEVGTENRVPIIAMTAGVTREETEAYQAAGMDGIVPKPIDFDLLFTTMEGLVPKGGREPDPPGKDAGRTAVTLPPMAGVDVAKAQRVWQDPEAYQASLVSFADRYKDAAAEIKRLADIGDVEAAWQLNHALKGAAGNLYISDVAEAASVMASLLHRKETAEARAQQPVLAKALAEAVQSVKTLEMPRIPAAEALPARDFDREAAAALLKEIMAGLDQFDPYAAEPALSGLKALLPGESLADVSRHIKRFDFDGARDQILRMAESLGLEV